MPRFQFQVWDGREPIPENSIELRNVLAARVEALHLASDLLKDAAQSAKFDEELHVEVTDMVGVIFFRLDVKLAIEPSFTERQAIR